MKQTHVLCVSKTLCYFYERHAHSVFRFAEAANSVAFCVLAMLWVTRDPRIVPGWSIIFKDG